jgi:hypothetical protein
MCVCVCVYIYIYKERERERKKKRARARERESICLQRRSRSTDSPSRALRSICVCVCVYIYIYTKREREREKKRERARERERVYACSGALVVLILLQEHFYPVAHFMIRQLAIPSAAVCLIFQRRPRRRRPRCAIKILKIQRDHLFFLKFLFKFKEITFCYPGQLKDSSIASSKAPLRY